MLTIKPVKPVKNSYIIKENNIDKFKNRIEFMYMKTIEKIRIFEENTNKNTFENLKDEDFTNCFIKNVMKIMTQITSETALGHTMDCLVRCSFDLVFRYVFDLNYSPVELGDNCHDFLNLQLKIFNNCNWYLKFEV